MTDTSKTRVAKRWVVPVMGTILQICLGTVYAWSFFQKLIMTVYGWNNTQTMWIFSIAICVLGLSAAWGGINLPKFGPRKLAMAGGVLYGLGWILGSLAMRQHSLVLFYLGYGIVGGAGLGLGYVTPVATSAKWFPDKKGFITGMVVMGFGLGALFMSKILAPTLLALTHNNLPGTFLYIGFAMLVIAPLAGSFIVNPPAGWVPAGYTPPAISSAAKAADDRIGARDAIVSGRFFLLWLIFFANICAGMMFIGLQSPMLQEMLRLGDPKLGAAALAAAGATLIAISSIFNGLGRFFWGGLSDKIGRVPTFRLLLASQIVVFTLLIFIKSPLVFGILVCYVLLCYGGGFGTMPSTVNTIFGTRLMAIVYGFMLTAWSLGGIVGPQIAAMIKDMAGTRAPVYTFATGAVILLAGFLLTLFVNDRPFVETVKHKA
jgi:MFS transporter, OFA family, oxalate/formate antiporter